MFRLYSMQYSHNLIRYKCVASCHSQSHSRSRNFRLSTVIEEVLFDKRHDFLYLSFDSLFN